jgi:hypothetical protein
MEFSTSLWRRQTEVFRIDQDHAVRVAYPDLFHFSDDAFPLIARMYTRLRAASIYQLIPRHFSCSKLIGVHLHRLSALMPPSLLDTHGQSTAVCCSRLLYHPLRNKSKSLSSFSHKAMD